MRRGYKQTEIGEIPVEWEVVKAEELFYEVSENNHPNEVLLSVTQDQGVVPRTLLPGRVTMPTKNLGSFLFVQQGDFLISLRSFQGGIEYSQYQGIVSPAYTVIRKRRIIEDKYFTLYFKSKKFIRDLDSSVVGIRDGKQIQYKSFKLIQIPLPPLPEQKKIAEILSSLDAAIRSTQAVIDQARTLKKGLLGQLLTRGIGHKKFKQTEIGEIPVEWEVKTLEEVCDFITKGATPTTYGFQWEVDGILFLRSECVSEHGLDLKAAMRISEEAHKLMARSEVRQGDILMTITGYVGRCIYIDENLTRANINQHIARIRISDNGVYSAFAFQYLRYDKVRQNYERITTGQAYPQISLRQVRDTLLPLPPLPEQKQIAEILSGVDAVIRQNSEQVAQLKRTKAGLMQDLLTGRKRVAV